MNSKKLYLAAFAVATSATLPATLRAEVPVVSGVEMTQDNSRLVTITYTLADASAVVTLDVQTNANTSASANDAGWTSIGGEALWNAKGDVWKKVATGSRTITWRPDLSWPDHQIADGGARAVVTAWALNNTPDYMVVDLAADRTVRYYPAVEFLPGAEIGQTGAITNNVAYKTSKLVMRRIPAAGVEWTMGSASGETRRTAAREAAHTVTLNGNYYIGVFEMTLAQWKNIATNSSATAYFTTEPMMRPMGSISYNELRNTHSASATATTVAAGTLSADPSSDSFLGLLRLKTGLDFDLPSEAQWEFAARAGHGSGYWGDGSLVQNKVNDANLNLLGRNQYNGGRPNPNTTTAPAQSCDVTQGPGIVGTYSPNDWGLYDMHGNVWEWCLDWAEDDITMNGGAVNIDSSAPAKTLSGAAGVNRVMRGGAYYVDADYCRSAYRNPYSPNARSSSGGVRVVCTAGLE